MSVKEFIKENLRRDYLNSLWSKCARRSIVDFSVDYMEYKGLCMGEDALQSAALLEKAEKILIINQVLYQYRCNFQSISKKFRKNYAFDFLNVRKRVLQMLNNCNVYDELHEEFWKKYIRGLNHYILKGLISSKDYQDYVKFRKEILQKEIKPPAEEKFPLKEKMIYKVLKKRCVYLLKPLLKWLDTAKQKYKRVRLKASFF
jgi:hypothetical protein